jgi:hypothetical protein
MKILIKIISISLIIGLLVSFIVSKFVTSTLEDSPNNYISECSIELSENIPQQDYKVIKKGYPFYNYEVEPKIGRDSTCISMAAVLSNIETYGTHRGFGLNWIFYSSFTALVLAITVIIKKKYAHNRH